MLWRYGFINLNATIVTTWGLMLVLSLGVMLITRRLETELTISRWQCGLEIIVTTIMKQIEEAGLHQPEKPGCEATAARVSARISLRLAVRACIESLTSENASRLAAMQRTEKNIDDLLEELNRRFETSDDKRSDPG